MPPLAQGLLVSVLRIRACVVRALRQWSAGPTDVPVEPAGAPECGKKFSISRSHPTWRAERPRPPRRGVGRCGASPRRLGRTTSQCTHNLHPYRRNHLLYAIYFTRLYRRNPPLHPYITRHNPRLTLRFTMHPATYFTQFTSIYYHTDVTATPYRRDPGSIFPKRAVRER